KNPVAVTARFGEVTEPEYFHEVEQSITWEMEFEGGVVAKCESSYADKEGKNLLAGKAENGWWRLEPAYGYSGKKGETSEGKMDSQVESFRKGEQSKTSGEMGVRDMKIIMAIYESANNDGKRVELKF